jgi:hypothetical protein
MEICKKFKEPDSCFLESTTHLSHFKDREVRESLVSLRKNQNSFGRACGLIINAIFTEGKPVFWLSTRSYNALAEKYPDMNAPTMSGTRFAAFKHYVIEKGIIKELIAPIASDKKVEKRAGVYELKDEELLTRFVAGLGQDYMRFIAGFMQDRWMKKQKPDKKQEDKLTRVPPRVPSPSSLQSSTDDASSSNFASLIKDGIETKFIANEFLLKNAKELFKTLTVNSGDQVPTHPQFVKMLDELLMTRFLKTDFDPEFQPYGRWHKIAKATYMQAFEKNMVEWHLKARGNPQIPAHVTDEQLAKMWRLYDEV